MNLDEMRSKLVAFRTDQYARAVHDLSTSREMMDLEPLVETLYQISIIGYEVIEGISARRAQLTNLDWPDYIEAIEPLESAADCAFYEWLEGMNLRYEATCLRTPAGYPSDWYVTNKVKMLAKLTFGGNL